MRLHLIIYIINNIKRLSDTIFNNGKNCYDYIISLGYNCEVSYKFLKYFKQEVSGLFNWSKVNTIDNLIYALENFDKLGTSGFVMEMPLWKCINTNISFHGKVQAKDYLKNNYAEEEIEKDKSELSERIKYLKEKFINILCNNKRKLYIYKIKNKDINDSTEEKILKLKHQLTKMGGKNFDILIVALKDQINKFPINTNEYKIRFIDAYPPDSEVTCKKFKNNWKKIYNEFHPKLSIWSKRKKYKFY